MHTLNIALDWTPNANHYGFYVAQHSGFYNIAGLEVNLISPAEDDYAVTPAKKLELGDVDLALCPTESLISYQTKSTPFNMVAIAALLQEDLSAIATRKDTGITSPKDLDGKVYSSFAARYEDGIVRELIKNDGGQGDLRIITPQKLGIWDTVLNGTADATWVFLNWEGVAADHAGEQLHYFKLADYNVPYSYSPVIAAGGDRIAEKLEAYRAFLQATKRGYLHGAANPRIAAHALRDHIPPQDHDLPLDEALARTIPAVGNAETWGTVNLDYMDRFLGWIRAKGLESRELSANDLWDGRALA